MNTVIIPHIEALTSMVTSEVLKVCETRDIVRIGLPGGRSVRPILSGLLALTDEYIHKIRLYVVDERVTGEQNIDTLMDGGLREAIDRRRMQRNQLVGLTAGTPFLRQHEKLDILYLGVGEDGHIASLFPGSYPELAHSDAQEVTMILDSPKPPPKRVSVTYRAFETYARDAAVHLLFLGESKRKALQRLLHSHESAASLPCAFFIEQNFHTDIITDLKE